MTSFRNLLRTNRNYRNLWLDHVVSEPGDHFNAVAVLSMAQRVDSSGFAVGGVMRARTISAIAAAPLAGVFLDRMDRKQIMLASDLIRAAVAFAFVVKTAGSFITGERDLVYFVEAIDNHGNGRSYPDLEMGSPYVIVPIERPPQARLR